MASVFVRGSRRPLYLLYINGGSDSRIHGGGSRIRGGSSGKKKFCTIRT